MPTTPTPSAARPAAARAATAEPVCKNRWCRIPLTTAASIAAGECQTCRATTAPVRRAPNGRRTA